MMLFLPINTESEMIPVWVTLYIAGGFVLGIVAKSLFDRTPIHDQGFSINRFSTPEVLETVAQALKGSGNASARPQLRLDSAEVRRIILPGGKIMNWTSESLQEKLDIDNAHAFVVRKPISAAYGVASRLRRAGLVATVIEDFDKSVNQGAMTMVVIEGERTGLIFRRHVTRMGGPRPRRYRSRG
jgi:hypothetical protein